MEKPISEENDKIGKALKLFPYFDTWNKKTILDCCRLSKILVIPPDNVILGSDESEPCGVHFIVEGTCRLIEQLSLVRTVRRDGRVRYSAFRCESTDGRTGAGDEPKYSSLLFNMGTDAYASKLPNETVKTMDEVKGDDTAVQHGEPPERVEVAVEVVSAVSDEEPPEEIVHEEHYPHKEEELEQKLEEPTEEETKVTEGVEQNKDGERELEEREQPQKGEEDSETQPQTKFAKFYRRLLPYLSAMHKNVRRQSDNVETHFLQIALIHKGGCLGLGENLQNRSLVSVTEVTCMVIPLQFLLQHNPNNIWNRIKQFLNYYLPGEEKILSQFLINRKWNEDKARLVRSKRSNCPTKLSDVPKSIRLSDSSMRICSLR